MNNQIGYQQIQHHPLNLQGLQLQQLQNSCQIYSPNSNCVRPAKYPTQQQQNSNAAVIQANQGIEPSPSNRFLSSTARVLKNQIIDFKQMIGQQPQQGIVNQQFIQGQGVELIKNQNGIVQMHQQPFQAQQKPGTPTSVQAVSGQQYVNQYNQGFGMVVHNYHRSSSACYNGQQNLVQYDNHIPQPTYVQYIKSDNVQNNGIDLKTNINNLTNTPPSLPISPGYMKQKQKCMTFVVSQSQPQIFDFVDRRSSIQHNEEREEVEKSSTRYSEDIRHKFSDSIQSTTTNAKTAPVSVISNYSPQQNFDHNDIIMRNAQIHLLNNPLSLDHPSQQVQQSNISKFQANPINHKEGQSIQQNNEIIAIEDYCQDDRTEEQEDKDKQNQQENQKSQQQSLVSQQLINVYYSQETQSQQQHQQQDDFTQTDPQINFNEQSNKEIPDKESAKDKPKSQSGSNNKNNEVQSRKTSNKLQQSQSQGTQSLKNSPQSQTKINNAVSTNRKGLAKTEYQKQKGKSLAGAFEIPTKMHQKQFYVEDKHLQVPYSPKEHHQKNLDSKKLGVNIRHNQAEESKKQKVKDQQIDNKNDNHQNHQQESNQHSPQQVPQIQVHHTHSKSSKDIRVNAAAVNQLYTPISSKKEQKMHKNAVSKEYYLENSTPRQLRGQESSSRKQGGNHSSSRQITFPESPISIASKIDYSCGFGSDITYSEDLVHEHSARGIKGSPIPLIATLGQFTGDNTSKGSKNTAQFLTIPTQQQGLFLKINNPTATTSDKQNEDISQQEQKEKYHHQQQSIKAHTHKEQFTEDKVLSKKIESKLFTETNDETAIVKEHDDEENELNPNFINLYKTPMKQYSSSSNKNDILSTKNQSMDQNQARMLVNKSQEGAIQNIQVLPKNQNQHEGSSSTGQQQKIQEQQKSQDKQTKITQQNSTEQNKQEMNNNKQQIDAQKVQANSEYNQQIKLSLIQQNENFNEYYNGEESPFIIEMQKQHQKIVEGFGPGAKPNIGESKDDLNLLNKESSQSSQSENKNSQASKNDSKKQRNNQESIQSINDLLIYLGGVQPPSNIDMLVMPSNNLLTKQNLSLIFDEKSNIPSKVCSLINIGEKPNMDLNIQQQKQQKQNQSPSQPSLQKGAVNANAQKAQNINNSKPQNQPQQTQLSSQQQQQQQQKKVTSQKNSTTTSQDKLKKSVTLKRQETPPKVGNQQLLKANSNSQTGGLKIQDLYIGQYSTKPLLQSNQQKTDNSNYQQILQKQKTNERKNSLIKAENILINKGQGVINLQKISQNSQQLQLIVQINGTNNNTNDNKNASKSMVSGSNKTSKVSQPKLDNKSINLIQNKSTSMTQNSSTFYQNNSTITANNKNQNFQKSNLSSQSNFQGNKISEGGGSILAESMLRNNEDQSQSLFFSQQDPGRNNSSNVKQNQSQQASVLAGKKFLSNKTSFEEPEQDQTENKGQTENIQQLNQIMAQYSSENLTQPYIKFGGQQSKLKNAINVEDTYQGLSRNSIYGGQDTDRSMKSDRQINVKKEVQTKPSQLQNLALKRQHSLHEKNQKQGEFVYNLQKEGGRNSINHGSKNNEKFRESIDNSSKSPNPNKNISKEVPFSEFKVPRKQQEQNAIQLKQNTHYRRESYSSQKLQNNHEVKERPSSIQKGAIHHSIDRSIHDLIEEGDRLINLDVDSKKKMLTSNSPIIHSKNKKKYALPLNNINPNQNMLSYHGQSGSYTSTNHMKNQYYSASSSKTQLPNMQLIEGNAYSFQQPIIMTQNKSNSKLHSSAYNSITSIQQIQKMHSTQKKEDQFSSPQKLNTFEKMK